MLAKPVLVGLSFAQQLLQAVLADHTVPVRGANSRLGQGLEQGAHLRRVDGGAAGIAMGAGQGSDDSIVLWMPRPAAREDARACASGQCAQHSRGREEDQRLDERDADFRAGDGRLTLENARQSLCLAIGQQQRVVNRNDMAVGCPHPRMGVATHLAGS